MVQAEAFLVVGLVVVIGLFAVAWIRRPKDRVRSFTVAVFAGYVVLVLAATMFPIALSSFAEARHETLINVVPFRGLFSTTDISREQAIPNIVLGIPFGFGVFFVVRGIRPWQALLAGLGFFLLVEAIQLVVVLVFPGSPRTTDINDVMLNTMGVAFGILGFVLFADWFNRSDRKADLDSSQGVEYLRSVTSPVED